MNLSNCFLHSSGFTISVISVKNISILPIQSRRKRSLTNNHVQVLRHRIKGRKSCFLCLRLTLPQQTFQFLPLQFSLLRPNRNHFLLDPHPLVGRVCLVPTDQLLLELDQQLQILDSEMDQQHLQTLYSDLEHCPASHLEPCHLPKRMVKMKQRKMTKKNQPKTTNHPKWFLWNTTRRTHFTPKSKLCLFKFKNISWFSFLFQV